MLHHHCLLLQRCRVTCRCTHRERQSRITHTAARWGHQVWQHHPFKNCCGIFKGHKHAGHLISFSKWHLWHSGASTSNKSLWVWTIGTCLKLPSMAPGSTILGPALYSLPLEMEVTITLTQHWAHANEQSVSGHSVVYQGNYTTSISSYSGCSMSQRHFSYTV